MYYVIYDICFINKKFLVWLPDLMNSSGLFNILHVKYAETDFLYSENFYFKS